MPSESCAHDNKAPTAVLDALHDSQAGAHRHKCCICAYQQGREIGRLNTAFPTTGEIEECRSGRRVPKQVLYKLPDSQAGTGRHKCAICAFQLGFEAAGKVRPRDSITPYKGFGDGSKFYQERAKRALPILVAQAKARHTITYGQLASELDMPNPRNLNNVLGAVGTELTKLSREWGEKIPPLTCIVVDKVRKDTPTRDRISHGARGI